MKKPIIAFDMDDVLVDSTSFWHVEINQLTGSKLARTDYQVPGDYTKYYENVWHQHGIDHLIPKNAVNQVLSNDQTRLPHFEEAVSVIKKLAERFELKVVTARHDSHKDQSLRWLEDKFPGVFQQVEFANGSAGVAERNKGQICQQIGAGWLIDDNPSHCQDALDNGVIGILFGEYGWHTAVPNGILRCKNWVALEEYFDTQ